MHGSQNAPGAHNSTPDLPPTPWVSARAVAWVINGAPVPAELFAVLIVVASHADEHGRGAHPSVAIVAQCTGKSVDQAGRDIARLRKLGLLVLGDQSLTTHLTVGQRPTVYDLPLHLQGPKPGRPSRNGLTSKQSLTTPLVQQPGPTRLYRWYDADDRLLYVGVTVNLADRQNSHAKRSSWAVFAARSTVETFATRDLAEAAEAEAIEVERPLFNSVHNDTPEARQRLVVYLLEKDRLDLLAPARIPSPRAVAR
jgi:predicted GIY-YIG superfamily endonuclease